jgi:hypothetical protein
MKVTLIHCHQQTCDTLSLRRQLQVLKEAGIVHTAISISNRYILKYYG